MFDRLIDSIISAWQAIVPFGIVSQVERGIILRFGKLDRILEAGFYWCWPLMEEVLIEDTTTRVEDMRVQSVETLDEKKVIISATLQWRINNIEDALLKIDDVEEAVPNACCGTIAKFVREHPWKHLIKPEVNDELRELCRKRVQRYGALIESVEVCDLSTSRTIRLLND